MSASERSRERGRPRRLGSGQGRLANIRRTELKRVFLTFATLSKKYDDGFIDLRTLRDPGHSVEVGSLRIWTAWPRGLFFLQKLAMPVFHALAGKRIIVLAK